MAWHLAQLNVARLRAPLDDPLIADFVDNLERVNALAEHSAGYVWRLQTDEGDATAVRAFDDPLVILNLTVWTSVAAARRVRLPLRSRGVPAAQAGVVRASGGGAPRDVVGAPRPPADRRGGPRPARGPAEQRALGAGLHVPITSVPAGRRRGRRTPRRRSQRLPGLSPQSTDTGQTATSAGVTPVSHGRAYENVSWVVPTFIPSNTNRCTPLLPGWASPSAS